MYTVNSDIKYIIGWRNVLLFACKLNTLSTILVTLLFLWRDSTTEALLLKKAFDRGLASSFRGKLIFIMVRSTGLSRQAGLGCRNNWKLCTLIHRKVEDRQRVRQTETERETGRWQRGSDRETTRLIDMRETRSDTGFWNLKVHPYWQHTNSNNATLPNPSW